jgi:hypothetical protein
MSFLSRDTYLFSIIYFDAAFDYEFHYFATYYLL